MDDTTIDKPTTMLQNTTTTRYMYNMTDDFSISLMEVQSFQTVIEILQVVTVIVCFTGLLLNLLCLIALAHTPRVFFKKFKLIISLSVSDSLIIFVILHHQLGRSEDDSHCLRLLNRLLTHTSFLATLLNLAMMALDTCFYTTHVYSYPRFMTNFKTSCMVFIVWSVSIVFSLTEVFVGAAIMTEQSTNQTSFCRTVDLDEYRTDDVIIHFIIIVIVIMSIAYIKIAMVARRMQRADIIQNQNNNMNSYKTVITTGLFILTFAVCWVPYGMFHLYLMYKRKLDEDFLQTPRSFQQALLANGILNIIMLLNSIADPLIYAVRLKEVRKGYKLFYQNILSACLFFSPAKCFKDNRKFATTERRKTISTTISGQDWLNEKYNDSEELQTMNEESPSSNRQANHANTESDLTMEPLCDNNTPRVM